MKEEHQRKRAYYDALYQQWKSSGERVGLFCDRVSVKYCTFRYWVRRIEAESTEERGFTRLGVGSFHDEAAVVLHFPAGVTVSFSDLPDTAWLKRLLS